VYAGEADITQFSHGTGSQHGRKVLVEQSDGDLQFAENELQGSVVTMELAISGKQSPDAYKSTAASGEMPGVHPSLPLLTLEECHRPLSR